MMGALPFAPDEATGATEEEADSSTLSPLQASNANEITQDNGRNLMRMTIGR